MGVGPHSCAIQSEPEYCTVVHYYDVKWGSVWKFQ